jgi:hypothetical protein
LPQRPAFAKRRQRLSDTIEALIMEFARHSPGFDDDLLVVDSTPVECGRSIETMRRSALADAADYGYCASHSRFFWGFRLHGLFALDGTPRALALTSPKTGEREVCLDMLARVARTGPLTVVGDKGYAGREFQAKAAELDTLIVRPRRNTEPGRGPHLAPIRQSVESIFQTCKDMLGLERHGARQLHTLRARLAAKFLALTAAIALNHRLGRPPRNLTALLRLTKPWNDSSRAGSGPSRRRGVGGSSGLAGRRRLLGRRARLPGGEGLGAAGRQRLDRLGVLSPADLHAARLGRLGDRDRERQHAVLIVGLQVRGVERVGEEDLASVGPVRALGHEHLVALSRLKAPLGPNAQDVVLDG